MAVAEAKKKTKKSKVSKASKKKSSSVENIFKIQISEKNQNAFEFTLNGKELCSYIDRMLAVTGFIPSSSAMRRHMFISYNKKLYILGYSNDTSIAFDTGVSTNKTGAFNFDAEILKNIIKNKGDLDFEYNGNTLTFSAGKFSAQLRTNPITVDQIPAVNDQYGNGLVNSNPIGGDLLNRLRFGTSRIKVIDHYNETKPEEIHIKYEDNYLIIMSYNQYALGLFECAVDGGKNKINLSVSGDMFNLVSKVLDEKDEDNASFFVADSGFKVISKNVAIGLPPLSESEEGEIENNISVFEGAIKQSKKNGSSYFIDTKDASDTVSSISTILTEGTKDSVKLSFGPKDVQFSFSNDIGSVSDKLEYLSAKKDKSKSKAKAKKQTVFIHTMIFGTALQNIRTGPVEVRLANFVVSGDKNEEPNILILNREFKDDIGKMRLGQINSLISQKGE